MEDYKGEEMLKEFKYSTFKFEENDKQLIEDVANYLDCCAEGIFNFFEIQFSGQKANFTIITNKNDFDKEYRIKTNFPTEKEIPNWLVGCSVNEGIIMLSYNDYKNVESHKTDTFDHYKRTIVHEFVHYVNKLFQKQRNCGKTEVYLAEGLACYLSGQYEGKNTNLNCNLEDLINRKHVNYGNYLLLTKHLIENYDKNFIFELIESNRKARDFLQSKLYREVKILEDNRKLDK